MGIPGELIALVGELSAQLQDAQREIVRHREKLNELEGYLPCSSDSPAVGGLARTPSESPPALEDVSTSDLASKLVRRFSLAAGGGNVSLTLHSDGSCICRAEDTREAVAAISATLALGCVYSVTNRVSASERPAAGRSDSDLDI